MDLQTAKESIGKEVVMVPRNNCSCVYLRYGVITGIEVKVKEEVVSRAKSENTPNSMVLGDLNTGDAILGKVYKDVVVKEVEVLRSESDLEYIEEGTETGRVFVKYSIDGRTLPTNSELLFFSVEEAYAGEEILHDVKESYV